MTDRLDKQPLRRRDEALLVQLADGALTGAARRRAEARLQTIPDADRRIERQRRVAHALGAGDERPAPQPAPAPAPRPALRLALAGALATVLALLVVLASQGGDPTVERAASISQLPATARAPTASGPVLRAEVDGVAFPDWGPEFGWNAMGMRNDEIDGRRATTVFYEHEGHRLAYTIVSGPPLPRPDQAQTIEREGLEMSVYRDPDHGGHDVAVFERDGHTCVVAGHVLELSTLIELASWKGAGSIRS
jgi:hypothetical protein